MPEFTFDRLTPRERTCLLGVRDLKSSDAIARELGIASGTVDSYIRDAVAKIGARDRRHAAMLYSQHVAAAATPKFSGGESLGLEPAPPHPPHRSQIEADETTLRLNDAALDQWRSVEPSRGRPGLRLLASEILEGTRPDEMTMITRALLMVATAVAFGFCFFALSAGAGLLFGIADFLRWLAT